MSANKFTSVITQMYAIVASYIYAEHCLAEKGINLEDLLADVNVSKLMEGNGKVVKEKAVKEVKEKVVKEKPIPLPFNGFKIGDKCCALQPNGGLYTQCTNDCADNMLVCVKCNSTNAVDTYGTIDQRMTAHAKGEVYVTPKGKKPTHYTAILKAKGLTEEAVRQAYPDIFFLDEHFVVPPVGEKPKGRPKTNKVVETVVNEQQQQQDEEEVVGEERAETMSAVTGISTLLNETDNENEPIIRTTAPAPPKVSKEDKELIKKEKERIKAEKEAEKERIKAEKEAEKERIKKEKEAEKQAKELEKARIKAEKEASKATK